MRAVIDTNIMVRAVIRPQGSVGPVLVRLKNGDFLCLYSQETLAELAEVLNRRRIRSKYGLSTEGIGDVIALIVTKGRAVEPQQRIQVCRDPDDDKFLEIALAGQADVIVSGDEDLLVLDPFEGIPIVSPSAFLARLDG